MRKAKFHTVLRCAADLVDREETPIAAACAEFDVDLGLVLAACESHGRPVVPSGPLLADPEPFFERKRAALLEAAQLIEDGEVWIPDVLS